MLKSCSHCICCGHRKLWPHCVRLCTARGMLQFQTHSLFALECVDLVFKNSCSGGGDRNLKIYLHFFLRRRRYNSSQHCYHFTRAAQRRKKCSLVARRLDASHRVGRPNVFESWRESRRANAVHLADLCVNLFEIYFLCFDATSIAADHVLQNIWFCSKQYLKILANFGCPLLRTLAILYGPSHSS